MKLIYNAARSAAPYILVLLLPGGSLIALALWILRHESKNGLQPLVWMRKITGSIPLLSR